MRAVLVTALLNEMSHALLVDEALRLSARVAELEAIMGRIRARCIYKKRGKWCSTIDCNCQLIDHAMPPPKEIAS